MSSGSDGKRQRPRVGHAPFSVTSLCSINECPQPGLMHGRVLKSKSLFISSESSSESRDSARRTVAHTLPNSSISIQGIADTGSRHARSLSTAGRYPSRSRIGIRSHSGGTDEMISGVHNRRSVPLVCAQTTGKAASSFLRKPFPRAFFPRMPGLSLGSLVRLLTGLACYPSYQPDVPRPDSLLASGKAVSIVVVVDPDLVSGPLPLHHVHVRHSDVPAPS